MAFVSLGCAKNLVDSEKMLGLLAEDGLLVAADETEADALVVNTCGFLEASKEESLAVIREAGERRASGDLKKLVVAGCLVQRHRAKMLDWCPQIDAMVGVFDRDHIVEAVRGGRPGQDDLGTDVAVYSSIAASSAIRKQRDHIDDAGYYESDSARLRLTPRHYAYLRLSEGCNQNCAFCTIPSIRGKMRSKPLPALLAEAGELLRDGAFELNLIGQDTTSYGQDIGYDGGLSGMLGQLDALARESGGAWLRLMYAYPSCFTDEMIDAIAALPNVVKYIDMPLQHISDRILESMRRRTSRELIETLLQKLRDRVPGIALRTTFITGYPTETEAEHRELEQFIRDFGFEHVGVFEYSPEPGTPSATLGARAGLVPGAVMAERYEQLMLAQQEVVLARNAELAQSQATFEVLIEGPVQVEADEQSESAEAPENCYAARSQRQAPEIDAWTLVQTPSLLAPGEVVAVTVVGYDGYDLLARPTAELSTRVALPQA